MAEKNCEVLFEYLRSILYDREIKRPDLDALDEDFQRLGAGLLVLEKNVEEMRGYTKELSMGNLSAAVPPRENLLCGNLKSLHANLKHLSWQARQIADGDYSQKVTYLGDFSDAFNEMIFQLSDREKRLKEMAEEAKRLEEDSQFQVGVGAIGAYSLPERTQCHVVLECALLLGFVIYGEGATVQLLIIYIVVPGIAARYEPLLGHLGVRMVGDAPVEHPACVGPQFVVPTIEGVG